MKEKDYKPWSCTLCGKPMGPLDPSDDGHIWTTPPISFSFCKDCWDKEEEQKVLFKQLIEQAKKGL